MGNRPSDDIILRGPAFTNNTPKRKGKGILVIIFLMLIILVGLCGAYWYFVNYMQEKPKSAFFKYVLQNNLSEVFDSEIYYTMLNKMDEQSYTTATTANFSTNIKNDFTDSVDVSKLELSIETANNKTDNASKISGKLTYSSNDLFDLSIINTKDSVAIGAKDIFEKYLASKKENFEDSLKSISGISANVSADVVDEKVSEIDKNKIDFEDGYKLKKANEYSNLLLETIPDESVTKTDSVVVTINSQTINAEAYTLKLEKEDYKNVLTKLLTHLNDDTEFLNKIVTGNAVKENVETDEVEEENSTPSPINTITTIEKQEVEGETEEHNSEIVINSEESDELQLIKDSTNEVLVNSEEKVEDDAVLTSEIEDDEEDDEIYLDEDGSIIVELLQSLLLNQKISGTVDSVRKKITNELDSLKNIKSGITATVYVRNQENEPKETIKVVIETEKNTSLDIEYQEKNKIKITFLSDEDETDEDGKTKKVSKGNSLEVKRTDSDVKTTFNIVFSEIKNKKVISKVQVDLSTEGSKSSKSYTNEIIVKYNGENEFKTNIKNEIKFETANITESLTEENSIYIDSLSEEEKENLSQEIMEKIFSVYSEKLSNLNFIDNNSSNSVVEQPVIEQSNEAEKAEVREKLINTVGLMMGDAQNEGREFTIQDLKDLQIEGSNVSSIVTDDLAVIKIDGYTFNIDKDFQLSE